MEIYIYIFKITLQGFSLFRDFLFMYDVRNILTQDRCKEENVCLKF